jgi:ribosomal protein S18 acetylase RimI-like enzyme
LRDDIIDLVGDIMELVKLTNDTVKYLDQLVNVNELAVDDTLAKTFIKNSNNHAYFAIDGEKVIGFFWGYTLDRLDSEPMMYIHSVDVIKEYRNQGVGKQIVAKFLEIANNNNYRKTFLITNKNNFPGNKLYTSLDGEYFPNKVLYIFKNKK